jgi:hypothetical protein
MSKAIERKGKATYFASGLCLQPVKIGRVVGVEWGVVGYESEHARNRWNRFRRKREAPKTLAEAARLIQAFVRAEAARAVR